MRRRSLRTHQLLLVLVTLVPVLVFSVLLIATFARSQLDVVGRSLLDTTRALSVAVEKEVDGSISVLEALATSDHLDRDDIAGFYDQAQRALPTQHQLFSMWLVDATGRQLFNLQEPLGTPLPPLGDRRYVRRVFETRQPQASDLADGEMLGHLNLAVAVPVLREGRVTYVLAAGFDPGSLTTILRRHGIPSGGVGSIVDRNGVLIARTEDPLGTIGRGPSPEYSRAIVERPEGVMRVRVMEGEEVYAAFSHMRLTGWTVGLGTPVAGVDGPVHRSVLAIAAAGALLLVVGLALAVLFGRRIAAPVKRLAEAAAEIGHGRPVDLAPSTITELEELGQALEDTARLLREQGEARERVEAERVELLARHEEARREAETASRTKDEFLAVLSHELRTPLTAIAGWVAMLQSGRLAPGPSRSGLTTIARNTRLLAQLIDDLLDVSRIVAGKLELDRRPVELPGVIGHAVESLRSDAEAKGVQLETVLDAAVGPVLGDPMRLQQVVSNLVGNAVKFTPAGGRVTVRLQAWYGWARVTVDDTGQGIDAELLPHIFDRFRQADASSTRRHGGLGLGLAIVRKLVELHGGVVSASTRGAGAGSTFTVDLPPMPAGLVDAAPAAPVDREEAFGARLLEGVRVLVVDDHQDTRDIVALTLRHQGANVRDSGSVAEALAAFRVEPPDVLVSDIGMPNADGFDLIRELRHLEEATGREPLPAIALTAYASSQDRDRMLAAGFLLAVPKPVSPVDLTAAVARAARRVAVG